MSEATFATALVAAQREMPVLPKSATNPHFRSKFVPLDVVIEKALPVLHKHGFAVLQLPTTIDGEPALRTRLIHESGETIEDVMLLLPGKTDPQGQGAALTYARRYALTAMLGLAADEDDDGNAASAGGPSRKRTSAKQTPVASDAPGQAATDPGSPADVIVHVSSKKGARLADLEKREIEYLANEWKPSDDPADHRLKLAAIAVRLGPPYDPGWDVPFS